MILSNFTFLSPLRSVIVKSDRETEWEGGREVGTGHVCCAPLVEDTHVSVERHPSMHKSASMTDSVGHPDNHMAGHRDDQRECDGMECWNYKISLKNKVWKFNYFW